MFSGSSSAIFLRNMSTVPLFFIFLPKQHKLVPRASRMPSLFQTITLHYTDFAYRKRLPKLVNASYEEQAVRLKPIRNGKKIVNDDNHNRPFYRYGGHMELIRLKEYYRMPRGHEHISFLLSNTFRDIFSLILVPCLDVIMIAFFPRNIQ